MPATLTMATMATTSGRQFAVDSSILRCNEIEGSGGDGGEPDPAAGGGELRRDPERAEIQGEGMSSGDEGMSSDGERGGDEYCDEYSWSIGAEDAMGGEFGGGPWSGEDPSAYGGAD